MPSAFSQLKTDIVACNQCKRLRRHCLKIAQIKRRAYINEAYWGKPIPGFGDEKARLMIVGLAPAAHGANRTGRIFTGDRSGDWLFRALHKAGFANQAHSVALDDGLKLKDTYITCIARCAPPENKPEPGEIRNCSSFLRREMEAMPQIKVWLVLGQIALHGLWPFLKSNLPRPKFGHGRFIALEHGKYLLMSYHPSQQNTFTGRLTEPMFDSVFAQVQTLLN